MDKQARSEKVVGAFRKVRSSSRVGRLERVRDGKRLVFTSEPDYIRNSAGDIIGADAWVELYDADGLEIPIDPHRRIVNPPTVPRTNLDTGLADPYEAFIEAVWDSVEETPYPQGWRTAGTVTTVYGDTSDGRLEGQGATYNVARNGTGTIQNDTTGVTSATGQFFSSSYSCYQQYWSFDTSAIADTDEVTSVVLELYQTGQNLAGGNFTVEAREYDWGASLTTADYRPGNTLSGLTLLASIATSGMGTLNTYYAFTSTAAFLTAANLKTGSVRLLTTSSKQRTGTAPTDREFVQFATANASGTTTDPKLTITHDTPSSGGSITFVGASHANSLTGSLPVGTQDGDFLLAILQAASSGTAPSGWTKIGSDRTINDFVANAWYIVRGASSPSLTWGGGGSDPALDIVAYRGAQSTPHVTGQSVAGSSVAPSVTTTVANTVLVGLAADYDEAPGAPSGMTNRTVSATYNTIADTTVASAGATGNKTFSGSTPIGTWSVVLAPAGESEEYDGGSSTSIESSASGAGSPGAENGSDTSASHTSSGAGLLAVSGSSSASISVTAQAGGSFSVSAGSGAAASFSVSSAGTPGPSAGSSSELTFNVSAAGSPGLGNGSDIVVSVTATGAGESSSEASGGSTAVVSVAVAGAGSPAFSGGSTTLLSHDVNGSGSAGFSGGSTVVVTHTVTGAGVVLVVDISIEIGPTVVRQRVEAGETRLSYEADDSRLSKSVGLSLVRQRVEVASSSVRERVTVDSSRLSTEIGENRLGMSVEPSRVTRME